MGKKRKGMDCIVSGGVMPSMEVALFHKRKRLKKQLAEYGVETPLAEGVPAQTFAIERDGQEIHIVLIENVGDCELHEQLALLAHEATHVANAYFDFIGEGEPAEEEWAYAVQTACSCLFDAHLSYMDGRCRQ